MKMHVNYGFIYFSMKMIEYTVLAATERNLFGDGKFDDKVRNTIWSTMSAYS